MDMSEGRVLQCFEHPAVTVDRAELQPSMQEAHQKIELLLDAFLYVTRVRDMLADSKSLLRPVPDAASQLQSALQRHHDVLGAGVSLTSEHHTSTTI
jgi:hypothetical protein